MRLYNGDCSGLRDGGLAAIASSCLRLRLVDVSNCRRVLQAPAAARLVPTSTGCSRGAEACRFGHARRRAARVFELATRDEPAWLVARREPAQYALGILYSLAKLSGKVSRASRNKKTEL
ncbi:hypothetical protein EMIHUDRAFT_206173 [Emiliania huxleyi CCMP1516]|uniref:C3H1-type domain-containing protein n=2 Tax=Emiliania huxleyi TaxID=2903 RepID=A0A0D3JNJ9_EMIH1|nr:hypothetical protein EMIHUDRAFT_217876 [Emiliania huxleyi CCMP1516]XP_005777513.1 hypothetical protein EMIHUDRAFT_206173 [Emiliania huxleyi CCMP1516]EOD07897.1 hypothetical protein EMIHUDRAFT_217876 [Emiliania huxleyi CCMP1516]EOD25084.1 hypothetical protein EMIHUDRAFT_206173 [Emiliania huxleyi CCMP1516]|eukprot:XP_005760326.1 hypothetical protein EMIHUDRAFT_217876 [Emiliania huxleyi CCMP1516]